MFNGGSPQDEMASYLGEPTGLTGILEVSIRFPSYLRARSA